MQYKSYTITIKKCYIEVTTHNNEFVMSADNVNEAKKEIDLLQRQDDDIVA